MRHLEFSFPFLDTKEKNHLYFCHKNIVAASGCLLLHKYLLIPGAYYCRRHNIVLNLTIRIHPYNEKAAHPHLLSKGRQRIDMVINVSSDDLVGKHFGCHSHTVHPDVVLEVSVN